ncbi:MAG: hypothetical protein K5866_02735 [Treponema sp.]|nr:hypothetical protein [Treponema sp.]
MKKLLFIAFFALSSIFLFAQTEEELFGSSDDIFFEGDGIEELDLDQNQDSQVDQVKVDLGKGILFQNGSVKVSGNFSTSLSSSTILYEKFEEEEEEKTFKDHIYESLLTPTLAANLIVDARPNQNLRMYTKFGMEYPFTSKAETSFVTAGTFYQVPVGATTNVDDWFKIKELFTDFSLADIAFFRFGLHTVTWGCGYFFSPVSDVINTSSINPEDTEAQVEGSINLRTQITFPGSQNCLWLYVIPSKDFISQDSSQTYLRDTALAGKFDLVLGAWEFGLGAYWKYQNSPKALLTASGSIQKLGLFGEALYQYGSDSEWAESIEWEEKTHIYQLTAGFNYYWKVPEILFAAQYYYDSNDLDQAHKYLTYGHNIAAMVTFSRIFGTNDVTASLFAMVNFGKEDIPQEYQEIAESFGISSYLNAATYSATLNYSPIKEITLSAGPYITMEDLEEEPLLEFKLNVKMGGGQF